MITSLDIAGLGVIDRAHMDFGPGLTVLTGETGAGKTMLLTSMSLLLGGRAAPALVRQGHEKSLIDGVFTIEDSVRPLLVDVDAVIEDDEVIVSRVVHAMGRSRAYVGGRAVPTAQLGQVTSELLTIHGQADQLKLKDPTVQRQRLDQCGDATHQQLIGDYSQAWTRALELKRRLTVAQSGEAQREARIAYLEDVTARIADLAPQEDEEEQIRQDIERLTNVEDLRQPMTKAMQILSGTDSAEGALDLLRTVVAEMTTSTRFDSSLETHIADLRQAIYQVEAVTDSVSSYVANLQADPVQLQRLHERRAAINQVLRGVAVSVPELLEFNDAAVKELEELRGPGSNAEYLEEELSQARTQILRIGETLRESRRKIARSVEAAVEEELHGLAMKDARFIIEVADATPHAHGTDQVTMMLQPHPSAPARPLGQGASGGELSRIMLAVEVVTSIGRHQGTYIFDEVDAGIGGHTATAVGQRLARLAKDRQVIVVTHLAQVAAFANHHIIVEKNAGTTTLRQLSGEEKVGEIVRMMGGDPLSETARRHACEIIEQAVQQSAR